MDNKSTVAESVITFSIVTKQENKERKMTIICIILVYNDIISNIVENNIIISKNRFAL